MILIILCIAAVSFVSGWIMHSVYLMSYLGPLMRDAERQLHAMNSEARAIRDELARLGADMGIDCRR